jgi:signal transduction histidine kinase
MRSPSALVHPRWMSESPVTITDGTARGRQDTWPSELPPQQQALRAITRKGRGIGLQGQLVLCFMFVLALTLGIGCFVFIRQYRTGVRELMGEQAMELAVALATSSEAALRSSSDPSQFDQAAANLVKGRNIVYIGFFDSAGRALVQRSRDIEAKSTAAPLPAVNMESLMRVERKRTALFGEYLEVTVPVMSTPALDDAGAAASAGAGRTRLLGYVTVGLSDQFQGVQARHASVMVLGIGCVMVILALPLSYLVVHRIFHPIRQLLRATQRTIAGDLEARVVLNRRDVIGELSRAFNEMVIWVKKQQQDLNAANESLAEANVDLEQKVEQRTAQVEAANRRLSQEIAEKEDFLRAVSHDLNAPLRNISGMATMLLMKHRDKFDEDVVHRLERIKTNVDVETDLINELLELSRIKTRRQKMELVDMEKMVWELRGLFENDLKSKNIELIVDSQLPVLNCERARIRQVFQNLIDNAIKYMGTDKFERQIHVGCTVRPTEAEFWVRDTGVGIEQDEVDKVFCIFRRGKHTGAQNIAGKGVGLASVKSIIETHNGRIWVESELGAGSTFRFTLDGAHVPACERSAVGEPLPEAVAEAGDEEQPTEVPTPQAA